MKLKERILKAGLGAENLDELVHEACSDIAADTNNDGLDSQITFLLNTGLTEESIFKSVNDGMC